MTKINKHTLFLCLAAISLSFAACTGGSSPTETPVIPPTPTATAVPPTDTPTAVPPTATATSEPPTITPTPEPCGVTAISEVTLYQRPSTESGVFGFLASGDSIAPTIQSTEGWLGFEPAVAQAANVGVFRNRWLPPDADVNQIGDCGALPVAPPLSPTACYFMAFDDTDLHTDPDPSSAVQATIPGGGYAAVVSQADNDWYELDLADSSIGGTGTAWLAPELGNFNGSCEIIFGSG